MRPFYGKEWSRVAFEQHSPDLGNEYQSDTSIEGREKEGSRRLSDDLKVIANVRCAGDLDTAEPVETSGPEATQPQVETPESALPPLDSGQHTPGPWFPGVVDGLSFRRNFGDAFGEDVLVVSLNDPDAARDGTKLIGVVAALPVNRGVIAPVDIANSQVLAAAPDLLAACKLVEASQGMPDSFKAQALHAVRAALAKARGGVK